MLESPCIVERPCVFRIRCVLENPRMAAGPVCWAPSPLKGTCFRCVVRAARAKMHQTYSAQFYVVSFECLHLRLPLWTWDLWGTQLFVGYLDNIFLLLQNNISCSEKHFLLRMTFLAENDISCWEQHFLLRTTFLVQNNICCSEQHFLFITFVVQNICCSEHLLLRTTFLVQNSISCSAQHFVFRTIFIFHNNIWLSTHLFCTSSCLGTSRSIGYKQQITASVAVLAEISLRSPRKLFIFINKIYIHGI